MTYKGDLTTTRWCRVIPGHVLWRSSRRPPDNVITQECGLTTFFCRSNSTHSVTRANELTAVIGYAGHVSWSLRYISHIQVIMVVADGLMPVWCQGVSSHHDNIDPGHCVCDYLLSGVPDYFDRNKISSGGDLSHYSSASLY